MAQATWFAKNESGGYTPYEGMITPGSSYYGRVDDGDRANYELMRAGASGGPESMQERGARDWGFQDLLKTGTHDSMDYRSLMNDWAYHSSGNATNPLNQAGEPLVNITNEAGVKMSVPRSLAEKYGAKI